MKKQIFLFAVAALALASCSSENDVVQTPDVVEQTATETAVNFDVYASRGTTRAGLPGSISTASLKEGGAHQTSGFGVFGYYTDGENYSGITKPNFFYNQQVKYEGGNWTYTPIKYWPNEFGSDAISDQVDRVTFFAYAPYVEVNPLTGIVISDEPGAKVKNITGMTRNNVTGDPYIKYTCSMDATNSVDLLYGVAAEDFVSSNSAVNLNDIKKGRPYIDVVKPGLGENGKIKLDFKHALAQLKVTVDAVVNQAAPTSIDVDANHTRIWVRSVTFEGVTLNGALNLNSIAPTPEWYDANGNSKITTGSITVYDGRKDGKEALLEASNEIPAVINDNLIQKNVYEVTSGTITAPTEPGVTKTVRNLFKSSNDINPEPEAIFCIPTGEKMKVTIVYDVETVDQNLAFYLSDGATQGSSIQNTITKTIDAFDLIKAGYCYNLKLHLGMRTVDFDATVTGWQDVNAEADLPSNVATFAVGSGTTNERDVILPATSTTYDFAISGLTPGTTPTKDVTTIFGGTVNISSANASGVATGSITSTTANTTTSLIDGVNITFTDYTNTSNTVKINFKQSPQPLNLTVNDIKDGDNMLRLGWNSELSYTKANEIVNGGTFKIFKNGTEIPENNTNGYALSAAGKTILLYGSATPRIGDVYTINIQSGNATAEIVSKTTMASFMPVPSTGNVDASASETPVTISGTDFSSGYTVSATKDGDDFTGFAKSTDITLTVPIVDYNSHTYVVTITKDATGESHKVTVTQNPVASITMGTQSVSGATVTLGNPTVDPTILWTWADPYTVTVYDANNSDATVAPANYTFAPAAHTVTFKTSGSYKFKVTRGEVSSDVSAAETVTVP